MPYAYLEYPQGGIDLRLHGHLAHTDASVFEMDGYLLNAQTNFFGYVAHLNLKDISIGVNAIQLDSFQCAGSPAFEAGSCIFGLHTKNEPDPYGICPPA